MEDREMLEVLKTKNSKILKKAESKVADCKGVLKSAESVAGSANGMAESAVGFPCHETAKSIAGTAMVIKETLESRFVGMAENIVRMLVSCSNVTEDVVEQSRLLASETKAASCSTRSASNVVGSLVHEGTSDKKAGATVLMAGAVANLAEAVYDLSEELVHVAKDVAYTVSNNRVKFVEAAREGYLDTVKFLLESGTVNPQVDNALLVTSRLEVVKCLLESGADCERRETRDHIKNVLGAKRLPVSREKLIQKLGSRL